jgi:hypothetical protein|tara:strand:- start:519 stop:713 length:195 start_codon:yes stop_codon:yes gene_type:complete
MRNEFSAGEWVLFQDAFYDLLEKFGVEKIDSEHRHFSELCEIRNKVAEFIEEERYLNEHKELRR